MAPPIIAHVLFRGLIALVPVVDNGAVTQLKALAVDSGNPAGNDPCALRHEAHLRFITENKEQCEPACKYGGPRVCDCFLSGDTVISIGPSLRQVAHTDLQKEPRIGKPRAPAEASDFSYIANMANLQAGLLPPEAYRAKLFAEMTIPFTALRVCKFVLAGYDTKLVRRFDFYPRTSKPHDIRTQALGIELVADVEISNDADPGNATLTLTKNGSILLLAKLPAATCQKKVQNCVEVLLENEPIFANDKEKNDFESKCLDGIGHDFAMFHDLTSGPAQHWEDRIVPHLSLQDVDFSPELAIPGCELAIDYGHAGYNSRPICPMASFFP